MQRGDRCIATFEDINNGQPMKGTINSEPLTDLYFQEHVRVVFDCGRERLVNVKDVKRIEPFKIEYCPVPECLELIAIYTDGRTEEWSAGIATAGELTSIKDAGGVRIDTQEELEAYGVDHFILNNTHEVHLD